jgi:hypothetical protein
VVIEALPGSALSRLSVIFQPLLDTMRSFDYRRAFTLDPRRLRTHHWLPHDECALLSGDDLASGSVKENAALPQTPRHHPTSRPGENPWAPAPSTG